MGFDDLAILSRRDLRTKPGVLTPGTDPKRSARPERAEDDPFLYPTRSSMFHAETYLYRPYRAGLLFCNVPGVKTPG
jgi:hypothetical protein